MLRWIQLRRQVLFPNGIRPASNANTGSRPVRGRFILGAFWKVLVRKSNERRRKIDAEKLKVEQCSMKSLSDLKTFILLVIKPVITVIPYCRILVHICVKMYTSAVARYPYTCSHNVHLCTGAAFQTVKRRPDH